MKSYEDLIVWQKGIVLARQIYGITTKLPREEQFGLTSQMRRAAVAVPSNIAEGRSRGTRKDFTQFLRIAQGSLAELNTQIILAADLYPSLNFTDSKNLVIEMGKMLSVMIKKLAASS